MLKSKLKFKASASAPQDRETVDTFIYRIGELDRQLQKLDVGYKDAVAKVKLTFEEQAEPIEAMRDELAKGVATWCEANRRELTDNGKVKTADFKAGKVAWRLRPASVKLPKDQSGVISWLKENAFMRFVRVSEEVNKEALLAEADVAKTVPGVRIGSEGENFVIEPFSAEGLEGAA